MIKKIFLIIKYIFEGNFSFSRPKKNNIVLFDHKGYETIKKFIQKKYFVLNVKYEIINLFVLLKTILIYKKINTFYYTLCYLRYLEPKIIIHHSYNPNFFKLKKYFPITKFLLVQSEILHKPYIKKFAQNKNSCDYFFGWGNLDIKNIKKFTNAECYLMGSIFNNKVKIKKNEKIDKTILYISQYRKNRNNKVMSADGSKTLYDTFYEGEKILLKRIYEFSQKKKLKLHILGCKTLLIDFAEEKIYFENILGNNFKIIRKKNKLSTYQEILKYKIILSCDSTLALEGLSKNLNVGLFDYRKHYLGRSKGYDPEYFAKNYEFLCTNKSTKEFNRVMMYLLKNENSKNPMSLKIIKKLENVIYYNYNNLVLKNNLNEILSKNI